ncbi:MAG: hypothetical protein ACE5IR_14385 [bacterium]
MQKTTLNELLSHSKAQETFKQAVEYFSLGQSTELIACHPSGLPAIKVMRVLMKLLETYPEEVISSVAIHGTSTCSGFYGTLIWGPENKKIEFNWDCQWKAEQEGFKTWYGAPDQTKAAQMFGYQCFEKFAESNVKRET